MHVRTPTPDETCFGKPRKVLELAALATIISPSILIITTAGTSQVLAEAGNEALPAIYILLAVVSVPLASGISAALGRWRTLVICRAVCAASLLLCLALRVGLALEAPGAPQAICIGAYVLEILFDTLFWLVVSEYLTTLELKRHAAFLAMAFGVGGILGGLLAMGFCARFPADDLLWLNGALFGVCLLQFVRIDRTLPSFAAESGEGEVGIANALRSTFVVLRAFPLTGAIAAGILLMSSLFCLQDYLALTIYAEYIPEKDELASFMGLSSAGQQAAELLILAVFGRLILERAGPLVRNLIFPFTTMAVLAALQMLWLLPIAVLVHVNANAVSNAVFEPIKNLNYAALPFRMLAPVRMLLEGVVYPAGIALSGAALLWLQSACQPSAVLTVGIVLTVLFTAVSAMVGLAFLPSLLRSLRLRAVTPAEYCSCEPGRRFSRSDIRYLLMHPDAEARDFGRALARRLAPSLLREDEPRLDSSGLSIPCAPFGRPSAKLSFPEAAAAGHAVVHSGTSLDASRTGTRASSRADRDIQLTASSDTAALGRALEHSDRSVRQTAARLLAKKGDAAIAVAARRLNSRRPEVIEAAIEALGGIRTRKARRVLRQYLQPLYEQARLNLAGINALQQLEPAAARASARRDLAEALADSNRRIIRKVLAVKSALGNPRDINLLHSLAQMPEPRIRSDAVEALASLPTGGLIRPVLALLDVGKERNGDRRDSSASRERAEDPAAAVRRAAAADRWVGLLAARVLGTDEKTNQEGQTRNEGDETMLNLVLFLKSIPLFRTLSFEDIARIANKTDTIFLSEGQVLFCTGDPITQIHVIRSGSVELSRNGTIVDSLETGASIGEHAVFGHEHHEVSAAASANCVLLRFPVDLLADLVAEHPQSLGSIASDCVRRLHSLYSYLAEIRKLPTHGILPAQNRPMAIVAAPPAKSSIDRVVMA